MSSTFVEGGLKLRDEQNFSWKIENYATMLRDSKAIEAQGFDFRVGRNDPKIASRWRIFIKGNVERNGICLYYKRAEDCDCDSDEEIYAECSYAVKNDQGEKVTGGMCRGAFGPLKDQTEVFPGQLMYCSDVQEDDGSVIIHCTFKLFSKQPKCVTMEKFYEKSKAEALSLCAKLSEKNTWEKVKILTMDNVEIEALKDILAFRSPVFETMFRSNMREETEGVIELKDFTASAVRVLLHYISTGELLPNWRDMDILSQLANAAEKYQFPDLLDFFDCILPSLCDVDTAKPLLHIAVQFRLKKAEVGILEVWKERLAKIKSGEELLKELKE